MTNLHLITTLILCFKDFTKALNFYERNLEKVNIYRHYIYCIYMIIKSNFRTW